MTWPRSGLWWGSCIELTKSVQARSEAVNIYY
jgi:hypothetical protein